MEPVEVVFASDQNDSWVPPFGDFLGTCYWQEIQITLEGLYILSSLGTALDPNGGTEKASWREGRLFCFA